MPYRFSDRKRNAVVRIVELQPSQVYKFVIQSSLCIRITCVPKYVMPPVKRNCFTLTFEL